MNAEIPNEVWVLGKGPSLDRYDHSKRGYTIGINETAYLKNTDAAIAIDYPILHKYLDNLKQDNILVLRKITHRTYIFKHMWLFEYNTHAPYVSYRTGTASILTQLLGYIGVKKIHYVGFDAIDGTGGYSGSILRNDAKGCNTDGYRLISASVLGAISAFSIEAEWEHRKC